MINEILQELENIIPKSLFSKIEADNKQIVLTLNQEFKYELGNEKIAIFPMENSYEILSNAKEISISKLSELSNSIYTLLNCEKIKLSFELKIYDVWGNENEGYQVNDIASNSIFKEEVLIHIPTMTLILSQKDIRHMLDAKEDIELEWSDFIIAKNEHWFINWGYFINDPNGKPIGEISLEYSDENIKILDSIQ